ncbi:hypothetical protein K502DRAFT_208282 [Neoconidiobolus thromboides FSU 785]|nr:hypothetical protein K502DRAFT_208282 [Neoconidiobolus thromboides FSU 785]
MEAMEIQYYRLEIEQLDELIEAKKELKLVQLKFELIIDAFFNEMQTKEININKFIEVQSLLSGKILMWLDTIVGDYTNSAGIYVTFLKKINRDLHFMIRFHWTLRNSLIIGKTRFLCF